MSERRLVEEYREAQNKRTQLRTSNGGKGSKEEDELLDLMDHLWVSMVEEERRQVCAVCTGAQAHG